MYRVVPRLPARSSASGLYIQSSNLPLDYVSQFSEMYGIVENISSFDTHSEREYLDSKLGMNWQGMVKFSGLVNDRGADVDTLPYQC